MGAHTQDVTVIGWVGSELRKYHLDGAGGVPYVQFRLGSTRRVVDRQTGGFRDGPTLWFTVKAWRTAAVNLADSLRKGDPVVVVGRLGQSEWVGQDGAPRSELVLEALSVGHDLSFGSSSFRRTLSGARRDDADERRGAPTDVSGLEQAPAAAYTEDPWAPADDEPPLDDVPHDVPQDGADDGLVDTDTGVPAGADRLALAGRG